MAEGVAPLSTCCSDAGVPPTEVALTVIEIEFPFAEEEVWQALFAVIVTVTASPFDRDDELYVDELVPMFPPFSFHWYEGEDPPFVGVAVNVAEDPAHMLLDDADTETLGVTLDITALEMPELLALEAVWQALFAVITTRIMSLFDNPDVAYVLDVAPEMFVTFFCH
jgi:hypothetical protein